MKTTHFDKNSWQKQIEIWREIGIERPTNLKKEWTWNHTDWSYHGAHTQTNTIVWYQECRNPHASTGGNQSFKDFVKNGPRIQGASLQQLLELYAIACVKCKIEF